MLEHLELFITPANTVTTDQPHCWLRHAIHGIEDLLALPRHDFYEGARVYVVRVQIDLGHTIRRGGWWKNLEGEWELRAWEQWEKGQPPALQLFEVEAVAEAAANLEKAEQFVDQRRQENVRDRATRALKALRSIGSVAA